MDYAETDDGAFSVHRAWPNRWMVLRNTEASDDTLWDLVDIVKDAPGLTAQMVLDQFLADYDVAKARGAE